MEVLCLCCQVDTSRFWSNYRHVANALSLYHSVKRLGIPDSQVRRRGCDGERGLDLGPT